MSANLGSVVVAIKAVDECSSVMGKIQASMGILGGTLQSLGGGFSSLGNMVQGFAAGGIAGAAITAVGEIAKGLQWSVKEAKDSEQAFTNLAEAVKRSGTSWTDVESKTRDYLTQLQKTTVYSDEALAGMVERLLTFGLSYDDAMKAAGTALDFAAAKHMDLDSAATLVGKALDGNTAILKRYGVDVATSKDAAAAFKDVMTQLGDAVSKAASEDLDGFRDMIVESGLQVQNTSGKLLSAKDLITEVGQAYQSGAIDGDAFAKIVGSMGITFDQSKLKAGDAATVLAQLNEQFGGAAQAQAGTYAGIQERLKNATSELGEKIGGMLLPALAGMTEAMIPVVDWFGKGVDSIQAWLTEVGKMPEVQAAMEVVNEAFAGFWKYLEDLWKFIQDTFGPALQELWSAFKDLWDALSPISQALQELLSVFGDTGNIDLLKLALQVIVLQIRGVAQIIKEVAPYIKAFATAFKEAADFITPILHQVVEAIQWFCDMVKLGFQTLYTWLVGGSMWQDMWNALLSVASSMIGTLLGDLGSKLFEPLKNTFTGAMQWIEDSWNKGWQAVQNVFTTTADALETGFNITFGELTRVVRDNSGQFAPITGSAMAAMGDIVNAALDLLQGDWQGALEHTKDALSNWGTAAKGIMDGIMGQLQGAVQTGLDLIKALWSSTWQTVLTAFTSLATSVNAAATTWLSQMQTVFTTTMQTIQTIWNTAWQMVQVTFNTVTSQVASALRTILSQMQTNLQSSLDQYAPIATSALTLMQSVFTAIQAALQAAWQLFLNTMKATLDAFWSAVQAATSVALSVLQAAFTVGMAAIQAIVSSAVSIMQSIWSNFISFMASSLGQLQGILGSASSAVQSTVASMESYVSGAVASIQSTLAQAWSMVQSGVQGLYGALVGHSIWTDMLDEMQSQTTSALGNILGDFQGAFGGIALSVPVMPPQGRSMAGAEGSAPVLPQVPQTITIPITVTLDGQVISRQVEQRIVDHIKYRSRRVA